MKLFILIFQAILKKELEDELRQRMQKRAKLDRDLDLLRQTVSFTYTFMPFEFNDNFSLLIHWSQLMD